MNLIYEPYKPLGERTPDTQYRDRLKQILDTGVLVKDTPQGVGAITCFGELPPMVFDLSNGVPLLTERKMSFWRKPIAEIIAFLNGARTVEELESYGCDFWKDYRDGERYRAQSASMGLLPGDLGPGSYGAAFHDYPKPDGTTLNQFEQAINQIIEYPSLRTHRVTPWIPFYTARGPSRKVMVAPCHGELHFRVFGDRLCMRMDQRSGDFPIGVPNNMIQYAALLLMVARVTRLKPWKFIHSFADAHIYEDQVDKVRELIAREPRPFPILQLYPDRIESLFDIREKDFDLEQYDPHRGMKIPYRP
jgi:thymidylate synthase